MAVFRGWITAEGSATHLLDFLNVQGAPTAVRPQFDRVRRPGVDGIGVWFTGSRGEPFQVSTVSDCVDEAAVASAFGVARACVGLKRDLYWQNALWGTVLVHAVDMAPKAYVRSAVGGQYIATGNSGFLLTLNWQMETLV